MMRKKIIIMLKRECENRFWSAKYSQRKAEHIHFFLVMTDTLNVWPTSDFLKPKSECNIMSEPIFRIST